MAIKKSLYGKTIKVDGEVQGEINEFIDHRIAYIPEKENTNMSADELMIENEMLRETLYAHQNHEYARAIQSIITKTGHSTSNIIKLAEKIAVISRQTISEQMAFRMVYNCLDRKYHISFENREPNTSKLQYAWKVGALPLVSIHMELLYETVTSMFSLDYPGARKYFAGISKTQAMKGALKNKITQISVKKP